MIVPNVTILILWSSKGIYFYNYGVDKMVNLWATHLSYKYKNDSTWPFNANIELVDYKSNTTFVNEFLYKRLNTNKPSKVSVIIAPEGPVGYNNAYLASKFNIPYIMPTTNPDPVYYKLNSQFNTSFFIKSQAMNTFRAIIEQYVVVGVKTIATVSYSDEYDKGYNYWSCHGAATYLAAPRGIDYVASFNLYSNSTNSDVKNIVLQLQNINPDAILWCDWQSCLYTDIISTERFPLKIFKEINYLPKTLNLLDCFNTEVTEKYIDEGLLDYITESTYSHPNLRGIEYTQDQYPYSNIFRSANKISFVVDELNIGSNIDSLSSVKYFYYWYKDATGHAPTYKSNGFWATLDLIESAVYRAAVVSNIYEFRSSEIFIPKNNKIVDSRIITTFLINSKVTGPYGVVSFDANHINTITSTIAVQIYPGSKEPFIIWPSTQLEQKFIYPMPNWSDRIYIWNLYKNEQIYNAVIFASISSFILIAIIITIIIHHDETDVRMLRCSHMVAICFFSMVAIWSVVFLWHDDMNNYQCNTYLWGVYLPTSFVIQMVNLKAYRLSIFLSTKDTARLRKLSHNRMFFLSLCWTSLTVFYLLIFSFADPPTLVKISKDPYRPATDKYYCVVGNTTTILTYLLVTKHIIFSIGCVMNIRNGTGEFSDGLIMKESFVILWSCIIITYIMHFLGIGTSRTYILRVGFMSMGLTMFCFRLLISRCYRHWVPEYMDIIIKHIGKNAKKLIYCGYEINKLLITEDIQHSEASTNASLRIINSEASTHISNMMEKTHKKIRNLTKKSFRFSQENPLYAKVEPNKLLLNEMHNVINDEKDVLVFRKIVEKSLLGENLEFILAINAYRKKSKDYFNEFSKQINNNMKKDAMDCYKKFIEINSMSEVNISSSTRANIIKQFEYWLDNQEFFSGDTAQTILNEDEYHHIHIFEKAYNEISIMLFQNIWIKYLAEQIKNSMC